MIFLPRTVKSLLIGHRQADPQTLFARQRGIYEAAVRNVWGFYVAGLFFAAHIASTGWPIWIKRETIAPLWPLFWANWLSTSTVTNSIMLLLIATSIPVVVQPWRRVFRVAAFVGLFFAVAYANSFGKIGHGWHAWIFVALLFCFLPKWHAGSASERQATSITHRQQFLTLFFAAQLFVMLFYSMSGAWKVFAAFDQMWAGQLHAFHPYALAYLTADRLLQTNSWTPLGPFLINYPLLGWPLHLAAIYFELFALVAAFRPALHRLWGLMLIVFHFGTIVLLFVGFTPSMLLLGLLFIMSPFAPKEISWREVVRNLPLFGDLWTLSRRETVAKLAMYE